MIIRTPCPQYGTRGRKPRRSTGTLQQRVTQQIEQSRRDQQAACEHWFVQGNCTRCGRRK